MPLISVDIKTPSNVTPTCVLHSRKLIRQKAFSTFGETFSVRHEIIFRSKEKVVWTTSWWYVALHSCLALVVLVGRCHIFYCLVSRSAIDNGTWEVWLTDFSHVLEGWARKKRRRKQVDAKMYISWRRWRTIINRNTYAHTLHTAGLDPFCIQWIVFFFINQ